MSHKKGYEIGSGNVFKDIGVPNAEEHLVKAQLVFKIDTILKARGLKQVGEPFGCGVVLAPTPCTNRKERGTLESLKIR